MNIMTKRGSEDNIVTYEHYCDTKADLANIPQDQISLGSVAIVLKDEDDSMGIYLANSNKEWISFSTSGGGSSMSDISLANLVDVSLANPNDGDTLVYDATSEKWVAQAGGESGGEEQGRYVHFQYTGVDSVELTDVSFDELMALCKADKCLGGIAVGVDTSGDAPRYMYTVFNYVYYSEYENSVYFENNIVSHPYGSSTTGILYATKIIINGYRGATVTSTSFTLTKE